MATKKKTVAVNEAAVRQQLKDKKVSTLMVAAMCGLSDRTSVNQDLRAGYVSPKVAAFFDRIGVKYE